MIATRVRVGLVAIAVASGVMAGVWVAAPQAPAEQPHRCPSVEPITRALYAQSRDLDGCFAEWAERSQHGDTRIIVTLIITDDGVAHSVVARFPNLPATDMEQGGVLPACVASAIRRVEFPKVRRDVDATVTIAWVDQALGFTTQVSPHRAAAAALNL